MADFERATWAALQKIIPGKNIIGCHFHWSQAVWMKVQEVELQVQYSEDINIYHTVHSIFALPFLPVANVQAVLIILEPMLWPTISWTSYLVKQRNLTLQKQMVEDRSLQRRQQKDARDHQRQYEDLWGQFEERNLTDIQSSAESQKYVDQVAYRTKLTSQFGLNDTMFYQPQVKIESSKNCM